MRKAMTHLARPRTSKRKPQRKELSAARLDKLIEEARVDAYDESEQLTGFYSMIQATTTRIAIEIELGHQNWRRLLLKTPSSSTRRL
jgi:hypothetical protein